ncbi:MAG: NAD-dependent epimerase/dehydratase family protein [Vicinamibacterales bacterium]
MRIFLTGATGHIGSAVLDALLRAGHEVDALVRTPEKVQQVSLRGVRPLVGDLSVPATYAAAAEDCDRIIHAAFEASSAGQHVDRLAIDTLLAAARRRAEAGKSAVVVYTSDIWVLGSTEAPAIEEAAVNPVELVAWRPEHERFVLGAAHEGVRTAVLRPGLVYGGARGIIGDLLKDAANGLVRVVGNGRNHWACVYDRDLADLYLRLVAHPEVSGVYHANDEADERVDDIVDAIARHAKSRPDVRHVPLEEARKKLGPQADALALDQLVRSPRAKAIGWVPTLHSVAGSVARLLEEFRTARAAA